MKIKFLKFNRSLKLQNALALSILLFLFKLVFPFSSTIWWLVPNELLVICTFYLITVYIHEIINEKNYTPLSIVLNAGILNALIFLVLSALRPIIFSVFEDLTRENFMYSIAQTFYYFIFFKTEKKSKVLFQHTCCFFSSNFIVKQPEFSLSQIRLHSAGPYGCYNFINYY